MELALRDAVAADWEKGASGVSTSPVLLVSPHPSNRVAFSLCLHRLLVTAFCLSNGFQFRSIGLRLLCLSLFLYTSFSLSVCLRVSVSLPLSISRTTSLFLSGSLTLTHSLTLFFLSPTNNSFEKTFPFPSAQALPCWPGPCT